MHHCMTGCIVQCSNIVHDADGKYVTSALEFETLALCGSNCAIGDLDKVAQMDRLCDELGLDTIETGGAIALAMDCGALAFGDADAAIALLDKVDKGDALAETIGRGVVAVGKRFNATRIPAIRGQGDPGVGAAHAERHRHHLRHQRHGRRPHRRPDRHAGRRRGEGVAGSPAHQRAVRLQRLLPVPAADHRRHPHAVQRHVRHQPELRGRRRPRLAVHGRRVGVQPRAGFGPEDNDLPEWMRTEAIPSNGAVFAVPKEEIMRVFERMPISDDLRQLRAVG